jgi:hypothetical protein
LHEGRSRRRHRQLNLDVTPNNEGPMIVPVLHFFLPKTLLLTVPM